MSKGVKMYWAALMAFAVCGSAVQAAPNVNMLVDLDAGDFSASSPGDLVPAWVNDGTLGGSFVPVGTGEGTTYSVIDGVPAVTFAGGNKDSVMTNGVSPNVICGTAPWSFEIWVHNPVATGNEVVFTWTSRNQWPSTGAGGSCMEFRYGTDVNNAVEHNGSTYNLPWGGAIPTVNQWHHVAVTRDTNGVERLYLDGDLRYMGLRMNSNHVNLRNDTGYFTLGCVPSKDNFNFNDMLFSGSIARLRIYDGFLTQETVLANYETERVAFTLPAVPPQASLWTGTPGAWETWGTSSKWLTGALPPDGKNVYIANKGKAGSFASTSTFPEFFAFDGGFGMDDGLLTVNNPPNGVSMGQGAGYAFDFNLEGGKFHVANGANPHLYLGRDGASATATIGGGTELAWLCLDQALQVGKSSTGTGYLTVLQNGVVSVSNHSFYVTAEGATGTVVVSGGELRNERANNFFLGHGGGAQAKLILNDGYVGLINELQMSNSGNNTSLAELYLNGGLIWLTRFVVNTSAKNYVYFNGGTLRNRDNRADFLQGFTEVYVQAGGAYFDVLPNTSIEIGQSLLEDPSDPGGGLTKLGAGTMTLRSANTFTGDIIVEAGLLHINAGALPSGVTNILVKEGAAVGYNTVGGATTLLGLIDPASKGALMLYGNNANDTLDFSQHPHLSFGGAGMSYSGNTGTYTPFNNVYRFTAATGSTYYDALIADGGGTASVIIEAGSARTAWFIMRGNNTYTGGTTINGGVLQIENANTLGPNRGIRDIGIYNGGALKIHNNIRGADAVAIVSRIKTDSRGMILFGGNDNKDLQYDLTSLPGISLTSDGGFEWNGSQFIPDSSSSYHLGGGPGNVRSDGLKPRDMTDDGPTPRSFVIDFPGNPVRLWTNNTFTGGFTVTNGGGLSMRDSTALGAPLATPRPDYIYMDNGFLRPNSDGADVPYSFSLPDHSIWVGDGGMTVCVPDNRAWVWLGDLNGTGSITNGVQDDGGLIMLGGANNTWTGTLSIQNPNRNDETTFAVGFGNNFSWVKTNVIQGNCMFGVATDLDITWGEKFERPLGNTPISFDAPDGTSAGIGLRKLGAGTLTLDMPNTYRRMTKVESGTLKVGTANAIPWGSGKGNLHVVNGNIFPLGVLDLNGFDVNANGFNGSGIITNSAGGVKTLTVGNNNQGGTFFGTVDPSVKVTKVGNSSALNFWKGASLGDLTTERGPLYAGAETSFGAVSLRTISTTENTAFYVGLNATHAYGLTGEYYWFDLDGMRSRISTAPLLDIDAFDALLAPYAPTYVESSFSFGAGFDAGYSGTGAPGSKFPNNFHNRNNHYGRWTGEFYAETSGDYVFATMSDDGSAVFINRQVAITNSYSQGYSGSKRSGEPIYLEQGWHDIVVLHHQATGDRGLTVFMTPPEGEEDVLPQQLLRPYPVTVKSLSGILNSKVEVFTNNALIIAGDSVNVYSGRVVAASADTRLIKDGPGAAIFAQQKTPEFNGQATIKSGTLELRNSTPFIHPLAIEEGATLAAMPLDADPNRGLLGFYYDTNYNGGITDATGVENYFSTLTPRYIAYTTQTGVLAVANSPVFWYEDVEFPGPYAKTPSFNAEQFRVRYQGKLLVLEPGNYIFGAISDDRMDLFVNGAKVIERTGAGRNEILSAPIPLEPGSHDFQAVLGQGGGGYYIGIRMAAPGELMTKLSNDLLRPAISTVYGLNGNGTVALPTPGSYLCMEIADEQTLDSTVQGAFGAEFEKNGGGTLTLTADNDDYYGRWYVLKGTLVVGDGGTSGSLGPAERIHVAAGAHLVFDRADDVVFTGLVTGGGTISSTGSGRVTLCNLGSDFKGVFTAGDFAIAGTASVAAESLLQGNDPLHARFEDGATLRLNPQTEPPNLLAPMVFSNATLTLQPGRTNAYHIDTLMIEAGGDVTVEAHRMTGLIGRYYQVTAKSNPADIVTPFLTFEGAEALLSDIQNVFLGNVSSWAAGDYLDFGEGGAGFPQTILPTPKEYFGAVWKGKILITEPNDYTFITRSDDNSMLFINGELLVNNNGSHAMQDRPGTCHLGVGLHDFALSYYQGNGGYGLRVYVAVPGDEPGQLVTNLLSNSVLFADPLDLANMTETELAAIPQVAVSGTAFTLEVGKLGVINGPGVGTVDITGGGENTEGTLLLNTLFIEAPGAVLAAKGKTAVAGSNLHVEMGEDPPNNTRTLIADFTEAPNNAQLLTDKTKSLEGVFSGRLDYKNACLYVAKPGGTVLILR